MGPPRVHKTRAGTEPVPPPIVTQLGGRLAGTWKDTLQVIDKRTLEVVKSLPPAPGKTAAHVEFDRYGKYALASVWESDGAIVVYDAATVAEVKRIPASKQVGKYNVWNKITRDAGTRH